MRESLLSPLSGLTSWIHVFIGIIYSQKPTQFRWRALFPNNGEQGLWTLYQEKLVSYLAAAQRSKIAG